MKKILILTLGICIIIGGFFAFKNFNKKPEIIQGEIWVTFQSDTQREEVDSYIKSLNLTWDPISFNFGENNKISTVKVPVGEEEKWVEIMEKNPIVKYAELKYPAYTN
jgi:uncharacterized protein YxeA